MPGVWPAKAASMMASFEWKPAKPTMCGMPTPVSASVPISIIAQVMPDLRRETAHVAHVLLVMHGVDHGAGTKEQQRLEEGVGEQVEDADAVGADAAGDEHVAELRAGRVGDDALDVVLDEADGRGEERGDGADVASRTSSAVGAQFEERRQPRDHEHAGGDHGGRMDQRRHRASGPPSHLAARCAEGTAPTCPSHP